MKKIYCIAICGMGMGSLAGLLKAAGHNVSGSDAHTYPPMSEQLREQGIDVKEGYAAEQVPADADLVIIGNAISKGHVEVEAAERMGLPRLSMADALAEFFLKQNQSIVVAGTHGKTSTASLLAWLLTATGQDPGFLIGGVLGNFNRSWRLGEGPYFVVEGDEYDTAFFDKTPKFLHYCPRLAVLNPVEFDHSDIYKDMEAVLAAFRKFISIMPSDGHLFACVESAAVRDLIAAAPCAVTTFGASESCDVRLQELLARGDGSLITYSDRADHVHTLKSPMIGRHNALNLLGVVACLDHLGIPVEQVAMGLDRFRGIKRRQEVCGVVRDVTVIDDFAHHPTAVRETLTALKGQYSQQKIWAIFEPRSNTSRTKIFQQEFADALQEADEVILAPPYDNGRIPQDQLLDVQEVARQIRSQGVPAEALPDVEHIVARVAAAAQSGDIVAVLSNGGFGGIHNKLLKSLAGAT